MRISFSKASDILLLGLWSATILFFVGIAVAIEYPNLVASVDGYFRDHYLYEPRRRYNQLVAAYEKSDDHLTLVRELTRLSKQLEPVQKADEMEAIRRVVYAQLVDVLVRNGDYEGASHWVEHWLEFDDRDVTALLRKGRLLVIDPEKYDQGAFLLAELKHRFPSSFVVADGRANAWASIGQLGRAFSEYVPFLEGLDREAIQTSLQLHTDTFNILIQPQFHDLIISQLRQEGRVEDMHVYEKIVAPS